MTLVELVAALVIATLVMVAVLATIVHLPRADAALQVSAQRSAMEARVRDLLFEDLFHARQKRVLPGGIELEQSVLLDPFSLEPHHFDAIVGYEVRAIGGRNWLVRTQNAGIVNVSRELVAFGVSDVAIEMPAAASRPAEASPETWQDLTAGATIVVSFDSPKLPPLRVTAMRK